MRNKNETNKRGKKTKIRKKENNENGQKISRYDERGSLGWQKKN